MTERPILFSGAMVRAILAGTKTQTRRVVKPQPVGQESICRSGNNCEAWWIGRMRDSENAWRIVKCPYGAPGGRLWVRETFAFRGETVEGRDRYRYRADENPATDGWKWRPAIHMPRAACRLILEVTSVRVERLQDISIKDAAAEGCYAGVVIERAGDGAVKRVAGTSVDAYRALWDSLNAKRGLGWAANPWVWVVSFRRAAAEKAAA